jgi:tetratricopeptide (TPR) repeat protein
LLPSIGFGQTAAEHVLAGDKDRTAMNSAAALAHYQAAIMADPNNGEALWRAAREAVDLGEFNDQTRDSLYRLGELYARRAVQASPNSSMAHFALAKALGRRALSLGKRDQVKYASEVHQEAHEAVRLDSLNAGALHVLGMWNASIMRLNGIERFFAKNVLGGKVFGEANWNDAARYLERAAAIEPDRIVHRLDLGGVYADRGEPVKAREQYQLALRLQQLEYDDRWYQQQAQRALSGLR